MNDNNNLTKPDSLKDSVLAAIKSGQVSMRPRWHFALRAALLGLGLAVALALLLFLASFVVFALRQTGLWFAPGFGMRGWVLLLGSLPWLLIILAVVCVAMFEALARQYQAVYKRPMIYSLGLVMLLVAVGGSVLAQTALHRDMFERAREHRLPMAGPFYRAFGGAGIPSNMLVGEVTKITSDGFVILDRRSGDEQEITLTSQTRAPADYQILAGEDIAVMGQKRAQQFHADVIHPIGQNMHQPWFGPGAGRHMR